MGKSDQEVDELLSDHGDEEWDETEDPNAFSIRDPLDAPKAKILTTKQLHEEIHQGLIDLNPEYQRDVVWPVPKQISLIDSLFRNFYIPPVIFATHVEDGYEVKTCVDGKQRLTSIQKFVDGQIPHRDPYTKKTFWYTTPDSQKDTKLEIPDSYKDLFDKKQITCVIYPNLPQGKEQEIFQRVQMGVPLTAAEKLAALHGPWIEFINDLNCKYIERDDGLARLLKWDIKRGRNFECLAKLVYASYHLPKHDQPTNPKLEKFLPSSEPPSKQFVNDVERALNNFCAIAEDKSFNFPFTAIEKRVAPVEFVYIGLLLARMLDEDLATCAACIASLRKTVRQKHVDVRSNGTVAKTLWETIESILRNPYDVVANVSEAGLLAEGWHERNGTATPSSSALPKKKRKRRVDDVEDTEYRPGRR